MIAGLRTIAIDDTLTYSYRIAYYVGVRAEKNPRQTKKVAWAFLIWIYLRNWFCPNSGGREVDEGEGGVRGKWIMRLGKGPACMHMAYIATQYLCFAHVKRDWLQRLPLGFIYYVMVFLSDWDVSYHGDGCYPLALYSAICVLQVMSQGYPLEKQKLTWHGYFIDYLFLVFEGLNWPYNRMKLWMYLGMTGRSWGVKMIRLAVSQTITSKWVQMVLLKDIVHLDFLLQMIQMFPSVQWY